MRALAISAVSGLLFASVSAFPQTPGEPNRISTRPGLQMPSVKSVEQSQWSVPKRSSGAEFLKNFTVESFGFGLAPTRQGFEFPTRLTEGPFTSQGIECPKCIIRSNMERTRYTLPPFGAQAVLSFGQDRTELFTGFGGINVWKPDGSPIEPGHRARSFNDAWLLQNQIGGRIAVDRGRHIWLGPVGSYLSNFAEGKSHWRVLGGNATFRFGR